MILEENSKSRLYIFFPENSNTTVEVGGVVPVLDASACLVLRPCLNPLPGSKIQLKSTVVARSAVGKIPMYQLIKAILSEDERSLISSPVQSIAFFAVCISREYDQYLVKRKKNGQKKRMPENRFSQL